VGHARSEANPPFGFTSVRGRLVPLPREQAALEHIRSLTASGVPGRHPYSDHVLSVALNSLGLRTRRGREWTVRDVRRVRRADELRRYLALDLSPEELQAVVDVLDRRVRAGRS
jgi:hypothetical protein